MVVAFVLLRTGRVTPGVTDPRALREVLAPGDEPKARRRHPSVAHVSGTTSGRTRTAACTPAADAASAGSPVATSRTISASSGRAAMPHE